MALLAVTSGDVLLPASRWRRGGATTRMSARRMAQREGKNNLEINEKLGDITAPEKDGASAARRSGMTRRI
jgi:hypothetical protein